MEKTLSDYDKSLEALDKEKERLETVMRRMGEEWAESGAGIGWMGSLQDQQPLAGLEISTTALPPTAPAIDEDTEDGDPESLTSPPISDYVQSLLHANQQAQSHKLDSIPVSLQPITEVVHPVTTDST
ncbi:hypothetical protein Unana1_08780 [Umbelopsis nana]